MKTNFNFKVSELRLDDLQAGQLARVARVDDLGAIGRRLADLGLVAGTQIRLIRRAPLGDPTVYRLRGYELCLRSSEARRVCVTLEPDPPRADARACDANG